MTSEESYKTKYNLLEYGSVRSYNNLTPEQRDRLKEPLVAADYNFQEHVRGEYENLEAAFILEMGARRFDVLHRQDAGELMLIETVKERIQHLSDADPLTVWMVSLNDILFSAERPQYSLSPTSLWSILG